MCLLVLLWVQPLPALMAAAAAQLGGAMLQPGMVDPSAKVGDGSCTQHNDPVGWTGMSLGIMPSWLAVHGEDGHTGSGIYMSHRGS